MASWLNNIPFVLARSSTKINPEVYIKCTPDLAERTIDIRLDDYIPAIRLSDNTLVFLAKNTEVVAVKIEMEVTIKEVVE